MIRRVLSGPAVARLLLWLALVVPLAAGYGEVREHLVEQLPAIVLAVVVVLTVRRVPVLAIAAAVSLTLTATYTTNGLWPLGVMAIGSYLVGRHADAGRAALGAFIGIAVAGIGLSALGGSFGPALTALVIEVLFCVLPWWGGTYLRQRSELVEAGWTRAALLESREEFVAEQARIRERAEIAREMHDSLGHELSLLTLSAGALEVTSLTDEQRETVVRLRETAVGSMAELHEIVSVLRDEGSAGLDESTGRSLDDLVARARATGTEVDFVVDGTRESWSPSASRAVYRVVQEILTNAAKHAPGAPLTLRVETSGAVVRIHASNPAGAGGGRRSIGTGLPGMRERVRLLDGRLDVVEGDGMFVVDAAIPVSATPHRDPSSPERVADDVGEPAAGISPEADASPSVRVERRTHRRRVLLVAIVPAAMTVLVAGALFATNAVTAVRSGMEPQTFDQLRLGQQRADLESLLPVGDISDAPPTFDEPARPSGANCEFFRPTTNPFVIGSDTLFRLCFADGELVGKDVVS